VAAVPNLASAAGWLVISQLLAADAACIKGQQSWREGGSEQRRSVAVYCALCADK